VIGVKVWIFKGEVFDKTQAQLDAEAAPVPAPQAPEAAPAA
jgi:ribosomal protein S3